MFTPPDPELWSRAGGDLARLHLYGSVGRVAPFSDGASRCLAGIHPDLPEVGAVGDWVGSHKVREDAESWLAEQGCTVARGPMELCTWFPYRANLGPHRELAFAFEPTETALRWEDTGYVPVAYYASAVADHDQQIASARDRAAALSTSGFTLDSLAADGDGKVSVGRYREAIGLVHEITREAFADAFGFAVVPEEALQHWYAPFREVVDPRLTLFVRAPDGQVAGFLFAIPDFTQPARGWFLVKTLAVRPEYRKHGLGSWLVAAAHSIARRSGYKAGVHCLMWTGSHSNQISQHGGTVFRRYALFEKPLV